MVWALPPPRLTHTFWFGMGAEVHVGEVHPDTHRLASLGLVLDELHCTGGDVVVNRFHALLGQRAGIFNLLRPVGQGKAVDDSSRAESLTEVGEVGLLWIIRQF